VGEYEKPTVFLCGEIQVKCNYETQMEEDQAKEIEQLRQIGEELIDMICGLCRRLNPQHKECTSCHDIDSYRKALKK